MEEKMPQKTIKRKCEANASMIGEEEEAINDEAMKTNKELKRENQLKIKNEGSSKKKKKPKGIALPDDGYQWHKYGQKSIAETDCIRTYHKCRHKELGCPAKKIVDRSRTEPSKVRITYENLHNHPPERASLALSNIELAETTSSVLPNLNENSYNENRPIEMFNEPRSRQDLGFSESFTLPQSQTPQVGSNLDMPPSRLGLTPISSSVILASEPDYVSRNRFVPVDETFTRRDDLLRYTFTSSYAAESAASTALSRFSHSDDPFLFLGGTDTQRVKDFLEEIDLDIERSRGKKNTEP